MEEKMENNQELLNSVAEAVKALVDKWGAVNSVMRKQVNTPRGSVSYGDGAYIVQAGWQSCVIRKWRGVYSAEGDPLQGVEMVAAISQYLASEDWVKKVDGSIGLMKRVHKALSAE